MARGNHTTTPASQPFFFYGSADHRDLHSFPTRRSSDLRRGERGRPAARAVLHPSGLAPDRPPPRGGEDRKSTRLNSSHRCSSYAVFCLKKTRERRRTYLSPFNFVRHMPTRFLSQLRSSR